MEMLTHVHLILSRLEASEIGLGLLILARARLLHLPPILRLGRSLSLCPLS